MAEESTTTQEPKGDQTAERLTKLEAENARLTKALADRQREREALEKNEAEKRGEYEKLYGETKAKAETLAQQLAAEQKQRTAYEEHLKGEVKKALESVEDETARTEAEKALEGLDPLRQRSLLALMLTGRQPPISPRAGAPGSPKRGVDRTLLSNPGSKGEAYRMELVIADLAKGAK
jgi:hypothetical protein